MQWYMHQMKWVIIVVFTFSHEFGKITNPSNGKTTSKDIERGEGTSNISFFCALSLFVGDQNKA